MKLDASLFVKGKNVIAVEVHNNSASSSDIYFDASLTLQSYASEEIIVSNEETYTVPTTGNYILTACYEELTEEELKAANTTPVKINEICASNSIYINEYFEKNDWIELYNTTGEDYDIAGMYISDNLNKPFKYQIPTDGLVNTVIKPYGYIVLWADKLAPTTQLHTSFKIGAEGGEIVLTSADQTWCDTLVYAPHNGDYSIGLYPDGGVNAYIMNKPTIAATNVINSYSEFWDEPIIPNDIMDVEISRNGGLSLAYNDGCIDVRCEDGGNVKVGIYTISGQNCMERTLALTGDTERISISSLPAGTYIVRAADEKDNRCVIKIYKK
jgi:ribonucleotide monophosphatase NagD (HAD superfamily)